MAERDIGGFIRDMRRNAKVSMRQLAEQAGVSNPYLSQIERGLRKPSAEVLQQLANALKVSTPLMYLRAGLLNTKDGPTALAAIAADPLLTARQKQTLTEIYEAFRRENAREAGVDLDDDGEPFVTDADVAEAAEGDPEAMGFDPEEEVDDPAPKATARAPLGRGGARNRQRQTTPPAQPAETAHQSQGDHT